MRELILAACVLVTGCGGGGGDDDIALPANDAPIVASDNEVECGAVCESTKQWCHDIRFHAKCSVAHDAIGHYWWIVATPLQEEDESSRVATLGVEMEHETEDKTQD